MVIVSGTDPLRDEAMKNHEENEKAYEEAMKENKEAIDLVSGDETKKKDGKVKSSELKKMHLSESLFEDLFDEDEYDTDQPRKNSKWLYKLAESGEFAPIDLIGMMLKYFSDEEIGRFIKYNELDEIFGNLNESKQVNEDANNRSDWRKVYGIFNYIVDIYFPDSTAIENNVYDIYEKHKGEAAWDEAWSRWVDDPETDGLHENFFNEAQHLEEDAGDDFFKKNLNVNEENDVKSAYDIANDIIEKYPKDVDIYNHTPTGSTDDYYKIEFLVDGDWKHDHLAFKYWMNNNAAEISGCEVKYGGETPIDENGDDDVYKAVHTYFFIPEKQEIQEPEIEEPQQEEEENMEETNFDDDSTVTESLKEDWAEELDDLADKVSAFMSKNEKNYDKVVKYMDQLGYKDMNVGDVDASVLKKIVKKFKLDESLTESLKFQIAKEQLKRFNEGKMPKDWSPNKYLENLVKRNHLTEEQKSVLSEAFLK